MRATRRSFTTCTMSLVIGLLCLSHSSAQIKPESIAGIWLLDEGSGSIAKDSSGHAYDADLKGNPKWVAGKFGTALEFQGTNYLEIRNSARDLAFGGVAPFSITAWVKNQGGGTVLGKFNGGVIGAYILQISGSTLSFHREVAPWAYGGTKALPSSDWAHVAATYDGAVMKLYVDGQFDAQQDRGAQNTDTATPVCIGARLTSGAPSQFFLGALDEVALFNVALTEDQIKLAMKGLATTAAMYPNPEDGATDVPRDTSLGWTAPAKVATHSVYFGASREDVNAASVDAPRGVLVGKDQKETTYTPAGILTYGQTYFWRVDEVNGPPDLTVFRGRIWNFTVEPYGYPAKPVRATASSSQFGMGPEKTIDGSGMTGDLHGTEPTTMWLSTGATPNWIQYEFDQVYKLHELQVWNSNQLVEGFLGFGSKKVTVETSGDGTTWTPVADTPEFSRAPGAPGYAANTTVSLGGVNAKFVKLTISANWGGVAPPVGLAEVRFSHVPAEARAPQPAAGTKGVSIDSTLDWRSGRDVTSERVYFGTDQAAVTNGSVAAKTVSSHGFDPGALDFGTTYYWKVDEVGTATYPGALWSFTTQEYAAVENFESYTDKAGEEIFTAWVDGLTNSSGSLVGYMAAAGGTFGEIVITHGGKQSMPFEYNNVKTPYYSEAQRTFDMPQDWTVRGADTLSLWIKGNAARFVETAPGQYKVSSNSGDIWGTADNFRFVYKQFAGDGSISAKVVAVTGTTSNWAKAGVMIRRSLDQNSAYALMFPTPDGRRAFQNRPTVGGNAVSAHSNPNTITFPLWVKVERKGNLFTASYSTDGKTWTIQPDTENTGTDRSPNPQTITTGSTVYLGLAVASNNAGAAACIGEFSDVVTTGTVTGQWAVADIGPNSANDPAGLYVVVEDKAGKTKTVTHPDPAATTASTWTQWRITFSDLAGINLAAVKKLTIGAGDKANPKAGGAGMLYIDDIGFGRPAQ